jgi:hypothetical protein
LTTTVDEGCDSQSEARALVEHDPDLVRRHLDMAEESGVIWNDPRDSCTGIDELEAAVRRRRSSKPRYRFIRDIGLDE